MFDNNLDEWFKPLQIGVVPSVLYYSNKKPIPGTPVLFNQDVSLIPIRPDIQDASGQWDKLGWTKMQFFVFSYCTGRKTLKKQAFTGYCM